MKPISVLVGLLGSTLAIFPSVTNTAYAQATTRLVATTGVDVGDCSVAPCATIQFAADVAAPGDTVHVSPGTYDENVSIRTNGLTLLGSGPDVTTIRGGQFGSVVQTSIQTDDVARFVIEGFTITDIEGASEFNAGITLDSATLLGPADWIVRGNVIRDTGYGIEMGFSSAGALIENNLITNNRRHGIFNVRHFRVIIRNNTIVANGLVGYREEYGPPVDSIFVNNIVAFNGTAMTDAIHPAGFEAASPNYYIAFNNIFGNANGDYYGDFSGNCCAPVPYDPAPGTGEISVDPVFRDPANGDYRLSPDSPSIDAGTNDNAPATDLDGQARPIDGNGDGTPVVDMGAFELREAADTTPPVVTAAARPSAVPSIGHRRLPFLVRGSVTDPTGVDLKSGTFAVTDEYGHIEPQDDFTIREDGRYAFVVWLEAWRRGGDHDGRRYLITVTAKDSVGNVGIASTTVTIRHDRRR